MLPRGVRGAAARLAEAAEQAPNPKLMMQLDQAAVAEAYDVCVRHLGGLGAGARRMAALMNFAASLALISLVVFGLVVGVLYWRGYL